MPRAFLIKKHSPGKEAVAVKTTHFANEERGKFESHPIPAFERVRPDYPNSGVYLLCQFLVMLVFIIQCIFRPKS